MEGRTLIGSIVALDHYKGRETAAYLVDGRLEDLFIAPLQDVLAPETLCRGKMGRPVKGLGGAFVDLPAKLTGFLRQTKGLRPGAPVLVQVSGLAEPGKAIPLTTRLLFKSRFSIVTPDAPGLNISRQITDQQRLQELSECARLAMAGADPSLGLILRSAADGADIDVITDDIRQMRSRAEAILSDQDGAPEVLVTAPSPHMAAWCNWPSPDTLDDKGGSFERHAIAEAVDALLNPVVGLRNSATMIIERTHAFVAVDVNTGSDTSPAAAMKANIAAIRELPRQLRLRGLGGQVLIDLAPCAKKDRQAIEQSLRAAFRSDGRDTVLAGWTPLGNFELTRKRDRIPLTDLLS